MSKSVNAVTSSSAHAARTDAPPPSVCAAPAAEPESLDELRGDCARMDRRFAKAAARAAAPGAAAPASASLIRGVTVPPESARLLDGMSEYGD